MSDTRLNVFIQDLKQSTTVLQQLEVCIKSIKNILNYMDNPAIYQHIIKFDGIYNYGSCSNTIMTINTTSPVPFNTIDELIDWIKEDENRANSINLKSNIIGIEYQSNIEYPAILNNIFYSTTFEYLAFNGYCYDATNNFYLQVNPRKITFTKFKDTVIEI